MKKFSILMLGFCAMAVVSCDDKAPEAPAMQANPQMPILAQGDIAGAAAGVLTQSSVLALEEAPEMVGVFKFSKVNDLPEGAKAVPVLELSSSEDFATVKTLTMSYSDVDGMYAVNTTEWNDAHLGLFGKSPKVRTAYYRIPVYVNLDDTDYRYMSPDFYMAQGQLEETCKDAGFIIYDNYYFLSNATTWDLGQASAFPFSHSDKDVYDDPVFTFTLELTADNIGSGCWWKIASSEALAQENWDLVFGPEVDSDPNLSGMLVGDGAAQAGVIFEVGKYLITVNMEEMTYDIVPVLLPDYVAVPSQANSWSENGPRLYYNEGKECFVGAAVIDPVYGFKFIIDGQWCGTADDPDHYSVGGGDNLPNANDTGLGHYWLTVNTLMQSFTCTHITSLGVIGGGDWNNQRNLTPSADYYTYEGDVDIDGEWKIRMNDDWAYNYGGSLDNPVLDGSNFPGLSGKYHVKVDFSGNKPVITATPL